MDVELRRGAGLSPFGIDADFEPVVPNKFHAILVCPAGGVKRRKDAVIKVLYKKLDRFYSDN